MRWLGHEQVGIRKALRRHEQAPPVADRDRESRRGRHPTEGRGVIARAEDHQARSRRVRQRQDAVLGRVGRDRHDSAEGLRGARRDDQAHGDGFVAHHRFERIDRDHVVDRQRVGDDIDRAAAREAGRMGVGVAEAETGGLA